MNVVKGQIKAPGTSVDARGCKIRNLRTLPLTHGTNPTTNAYQAQWFDDLVQTDSTGGTIGVTLPQDPAPGQVCELVNISVGTNGTTVTTGGSKNIIGTGLTAGTSQVVNAAAYKSTKFTFLDNTTGWLAQSL